MIIFFAVDLVIYLAHRGVSGQEFIASHTTENPTNTDLQFKECVYGRKKEREYRAREQERKEKGTNERKKNETKNERDNKRWRE